MLVQRAPSGPLAEYVQTLWYSDSLARSYARELALPSGAMTLTINLGAEPIRIYSDANDETGLTFHETAVWGPQMRTVARDTSRTRTVVGVHFRPGMAGAILGLNAVEIANGFVSLDDLWGNRAKTLRQAVGEASTPRTMLDTAERNLMERLMLSAIPSRVIRHAISELSRADAPSISELERQAGCSARRFIGMFTTATGMTPARFRRLMRLQRVLKDAAVEGARPDWARIAADAGFADQPHLTHDFKAFSGLTPGQYHPVSPCRFHHVAAREEKNYKTT